MQSSLKTKGRIAVWLQQMKIQNPILENRNNVAIYCRLSVDDGVDQESQSIENQKNILSKKVLEKGWNIFNYYVDDGFSGTNFERPGFQRMISDIESGLIDIVITKDLSRLGRDYIETGRLTEKYFPEHNVRYIALNDNVDTSNGVDDFVPFKNIVNEFYAKDISRKVRSTVLYQMQSGVIKRAAIPLYGYAYDEKSRRVIDPETAPNVVLIFNLFTKGYSLKGIADYLCEHKVKTPNAYNYEKTGKGRTFGVNPYSWNSDSIERILKNREYLGHYIRGKTTHRFKSKIIKKVSAENQYVFENVFEPIVTKEVFDFAQKMFFRNTLNGALKNPFSGMLYCGICGKPLKLSRHTNSRGVYEERYHCANSHEIGAASIKADQLTEVIKLELMDLKRAILEHKQEFEILANHRIERLNLQMPSNSNEIRKAKAKARISELNRYIQALFEKKVDSLMDDDSYARILKEYSEEKDILETELKKLEVIDEVNKTNQEKVVQEHIDFVKGIESLDENNYLSGIILRNIISKIMITTFQQEKGRELGKNITIYYHFCDELIKDFIKEKTKDDCVTCTN